MSEDRPRRRRETPEASERQQSLERALGGLTPEQLDALTPEDVETYERQPHRPLPAIHTRAELQQLEVDAIDSRLSRLDPARQRRRVRSALSIWRSRVDALGAHDATVHKIRDGIDAAKTKRDDLVEKTKGAAAKALLDNRSVPDNAAGRKAVAREVEKIEAGQSALELAEPQRAELEAVERQAFADLCDRVHDLVGADILADLGRAQKALVAMAPALVSLIAADIVRTELLGNKWSFDPSRVRPLSGEIVVRAFVDSIPERLQSDELTGDALRTAAEHIARKTLADIEKKETEQCD